MDRVPTLLQPHERTPDAERLIDALRHTGDLIREDIAIPGTDVTVPVIRPADIDPLLDQAADDPEQNLPYWAEIWPSGIALAAAIHQQPNRLAGQPAIELGSGVGMTAAVALTAGAHLVATDYAAESLTMTRLTSRLYAGAEPAVRRLNWRDPDAVLLQDTGERWPVILAADVLYEERDIDPVLDVFSRILAPGGFVWLAEPGRRPSRLAIERARERGWHIETTDIAGPWPDAKDAGVVVHVHVMCRPEFPH